MAVDGLYCADVPLRNYSLADFFVDSAKRLVYDILFCRLIVVINLFG